MSKGYNLTQDLFIDWLSFSFKYDDLDNYNFVHRSEYNQFTYLFNIAFPELKAIEYVSEGCFRSIYDKCIRCSYDILVYYDEESEQKKGCYVTIPSHSIEYFCTLFNCTNILSLFDLIIKRGGSFSRIDICYDDLSKRFNARDYRNWFENGYFNTRLRKYSYVSSSLSDTGTFYLGHRAGLKYIRIYDKLYESTKAYNQGKTDEIIDAIRYEFEMHSYAAQSFAEFLIEHESIDFRWFIFQFFKIIDKDANNNISRCPLLPEWEEWIADNLKFNEELLVKFKVNMKPKSYESSRAWFKNYCLKVANRIWQHEGEKFLEEIKQAFSEESIKDRSDFKIYKEVLLDESEKEN